MIFGFRDDEYPAPTPGPFAISDEDARRFAQQWGQHFASWPRVLVARILGREALLGRLRSDRKRMVDYLDLRREREDWHGVQDAASDIREIDAQIDLLTEGVRGR